VEEPDNSRKWHRLCSPPPMAPLRLLALLACRVGVAQAHGAINRPPPRNNEGGKDFHAQPGCSGEACYWYAVGCMSGCKCSGYEKDIVNGGYYAQPEDFGCHSPLEPTHTDPKYRTWNIGNHSKQGDWTRYFPWRAPGSSEPIDACGIASGFVTRPSGGSYSPHSYTPGTNGSTGLPPLSGTPTVWTAGATVEVSFGQFVNHGGGYQYRLCPKHQQPTEACFQRHVLPFASAHSKIRWEDGSGKADVAIDAVDLSTGTTPTGSTWRRNPIPACNCDSGFACGGSQQNVKPYDNQPTPPGRNTQCDTGVQFPPPTDGVFGYWVSNSGKDLLQKVSIVDELIVPMEAGEYWLSWRWDCEQTPQIWNSCADVTVSKSAEVEA